MPRSHQTNTDLAGQAAASRERFLKLIRPRIEILNRAGVALLEGRLKPDLCVAAQRETHHLAGLLATMGFGAGSRFIREMEEILNSGAAPGSGAAMRYSELLVALGLDLDTPLAPAAAQPQSGASAGVNLLIVSNDDSFCALLEMEVLARGWTCKVAGNYAEAQSLTATSDPDLALVDLTLPGANHRAALEFLKLLSERTPPVPALALSACDTLDARVEAAKRKTRGFMLTTSSLPEIVEAAARLVEHHRSRDLRIMTTGGDPELHALLSSFFTTGGAGDIVVKTAADPFRFWEEFGTFGADLVVLSDNMPFPGCAELCRVMRGDPKLGEIPIVVVTGHGDPGALCAMYAAGADDVVVKPIEGLELLALVMNRLNRVKMRRSIAESEMLAGALNRSKSSHMMGDLIELSRKHGQPFCLAAIEVDGLEQSGIRHAPAALEQIGRMLRRAFRSEDMLARWGGNVFVAGMCGLSRFDGVERLDELLAKIQNKEFEPEPGTGIKVNLCAGVAQFPDDGETIEELYRSAAAALEQAKKPGGGKAVSAGWITATSDEARQLDIALVMRDEAQAFLLLRALESRGYRARWLKDGKTAKRLIAGSGAQIRPKVVLMDVDLPGIDGVSLLGQFAQDGVMERTRVIMLTEPSVSERAQAVIELGAYDQVAKPFNPAIVVQHIRRAMEAS